MQTQTALERAIVEQIAFLERELERIRAGRRTVADRLANDQADDWMRPALTDPGFQSWLLARQLESEVQ